MAIILEQCKGTIKDGLCMKCFNRAASSSSVCIQMYEIEVPVPPKESIPVCHCPKCDPLANGLPPNLFQSKSGEPGNEAKKEEERILCAAIWYDDGKDYRMQPTNIKSGIVVSGHRHPHCKVILMSWLYPNWQTDGLQEQIKNEVNNKEVQGFLTSKCRFIDRVEAAKIWKEQGNELKYSTYELFSEDLY